MIDATTRDEASDGVRGRILAAGKSEFAARGHDAASVRTIATRAGTTAAMINYYFGGKAALHAAVVDEAQAGLQKRLGEAVAAGDLAGVPSRLAVAYFDFLAEEHELQRLLLRDVLDGGARREALVRKHLAPLTALLRKQGRGRAEATQLAISLFGAIAGYFLYEPVLGELLGRPPLSAGALAARRAHIVQLAALIEGVIR